MLMFQEKLLGQSQWKDYSGPMGPPPGHHHAPPPHHNYGYDAFETEDTKMGGWGHSGGHGGHSGGHHNTTSRGREPSYEKYARTGGGQEKYSRSSNGQHSLQRGSSAQPPPSAYPMGYSSFDRRSGGHGGMMASMPSSNPDYPPPDHYFMKSQRKYSGEELRVYVDYNK